MKRSTSSVNPKYRLVSLEEALKEYPQYIHASHILFWTKEVSEDQEVVYGLMQMRSDGRFGFPGGKSDEKTVDSKEIVSALYREVYEEMDFKVGVGQISLENRLFSHVSQSRKVLHFFVKELPIETFAAIERTHMNARDFPSESVGLIRIPLRVIGRDTYPPVRKFFKGFAKQEFAGNAKNQMIDALVRLGLIGDRDLPFVSKVMTN